MAINPELITTIRVDQLPDGTLNLTNKIPHTSGTVLEKASVQELVDLVATAIGVSGGVGYIAISVTDGQQLPDVPELPSFFLCGAGTFLNINGYPNIICTENLNAIMSLTDHWELAVEIPINPLSGTVQSVTGSAVDNTDPLNPVINEIIFGVQNIVAGTNITVDNTDPANPIVSATGGGGSQTLAEVLLEGNITDGTDISISDGDKIVLDNGANLKKGTTDAGLGGTKGIALRCAVDYELKWEAGRLYVMGGDGFTIREVSHNFTTTPTVNDDDTKGFVVDSRWILDNGNVYVCTDDTTGAAVWELQDLGTIPTLQQVLDNNHDLVDNNNFQGTGAGLNNTGNDVNAFGQSACEENTGAYINAFGFISGGGNTGNNNNFFGNLSGNGNEGNNVNALGEVAANGNTGNSVNALGNGAGVDNTGNAVNALGQETAVENIGNDVNALGFRAGVNNTFNNVNLFGETAQADENGQTVLSKDGTIMARISTTDLTATRKYNLQDGDGTLAFLSDITGGGSGGGGASISFYLNGSVSQGTIGGIAFREMDRTPILGAGTDFTINADGYIQSFITDANVPNLLEIPAGNWNFETYFSASSGGGSPSFYVELYKWDGTTLSLIASNSASPRLITDGTNIEAYFSALAVPQTTLLATDRLAVRIYVTHSGRTITLHTENSHLCQVITTFSTGITALNGLTAQVQNLAVGTSGTDFAISSASATHTFNLPTASATNRGALSSTDWSTFNNKLTKNNWIDYSATSTIVGWSSFTIKEIWILIVGDILFCQFLLNGTSNSTTTSFTINNNNPNATLINVNTYAVNNGATQIGPGRIAIQNGSNVVTLARLADSAAYSAIGNKQAIGQFFMKL
jgi:hypothetical protein